MSKIKFSQQKQRAILVLGFYCKVVSTTKIGDFTNLEKWAFAATHG